MGIFCPHCSKYVKSANGLDRHIDANPTCLEARKNRLGIGRRKGQLKASNPKMLCGKTNEHEQHMPAEGSNLKRTRAWVGNVLDELSKSFGKKIARRTSRESSSKYDLFLENADVDQTDHDHEYDNKENNYEHDGPNFGNDADDNNQPVDFPAYAGGMEAMSVSDLNNDRIINAVPNTTMREKFKAYCVRAGQEFRGSFSNPQLRGIELMVLLQSKRASLDTYNGTIAWYHRANGHIKKGESLSNVSNVRGEEFISREKLLRLLKERYNMQDKFPTLKKVFLPHARVMATLTCHDAWHCIESLLTDPRITDDDYNFHDNNPFAAPPKPKQIGELHTAQAYYDAHRQFITKPTQMLLPFVMYIDGAVTVSFRTYQSPR